jgi:CDP-paratose 2-epimerase
VSVAIVTGSSGLIGGESVEFFCPRFDRVIGIDNDMRSYFFGEAASTRTNQARLAAKYTNFTPRSTDIRDFSALAAIFAEYTTDIRLVVHAAAQPSHDWAATEPLTDFSVNATGTVNLLELTRLHCPDAVFVFTSTNKVYGDTPNRLPIVELDTRWDLREDHRFFRHGIDESMSIDDTKHSLFGAGKVAADIYVQEYGKYFGMKTVAFRGGCLTGPTHAGAKLHGFLSYLMKCAVRGDTYTIFGYKGKQVRDNIHSYDLVQAFWEFYGDPHPGEVYNIGGGRDRSCSILEAICLCEQITGKKMKVCLSEENRIGDHVWYISDTAKFKRHFPRWDYTRDLETMLSEIYAGALK